MQANKNRPTCRLCQTEDGQGVKSIRIGVWLCKRHWREIVRYVNADTGTFDVRVKDVPTEQRVIRALIRKSDSRIVGNQDVEG